MKKEIIAKQFQEDFLTSKARFPAFVAGWGTGKTYFGLLKLVKQALKHKNNLLLVVRKEFTDLHDSTIKDFEEYFKIHVPSNKDVVFGNGTVIMFRHGDELPVLQNINLGGFLMEQGEEFETDDGFQMLRGRLRRRGVDRFGAVIANTKGHNWIWKKWKKGDLGDKPSEEEIKEIVLDSGLGRDEILAAFNPEHYKLHEATTYDNKDNLPQDFLLDLVRMKKESPHHYNRFVLNSWEDLDVEDKVIPYSAIIGAINKKLVPLRMKKVVSIDPSEFGEDETVIYGIQSGKLIKRDIFFRKELYETSDRAFEMAYAFDCTHIVVDPIGVGAGLRSFMSKRGEKEGIKILSADNREKAVDPKNYFNRRAEIWFNGRNRFVDGTVCLPDDDDQLVEELSKVGYSMQSDKTRKIHPKEKIRKADYLGHSPGRAECLLNGLWAEDFVEFEDVRKGFGEDYGYEKEDEATLAYTVKTEL